jgi:hypothetical protein
MSKKYNGVLGVAPMTSDKRVVMIDDFKGNYRDFDVLEQALEARQQDSATDKWAVFKMIFEFNPARSEYERRF